MYRPGEQIVYGGDGVCRVEEIVPMGFDGGEEELYYVLQPLWQSGTIYAPVEGGVFSRPILSREEVEALVDEIPETEPAEFGERSAQLLVQRYEGVLSSHDCRALLRMTMALYRKQERARQSGRRFGQIDSRFMKRAEELLFGEIAAALEIDLTEVPGWIAGRIAGGEEAEPVRG